MRSYILALLPVLAAVAGVFTLNWSPVEGDFSAIEVRYGDTIVKTLEPVDGAFQESLEVKESFFVIPDGCIGCGICVDQCPVSAISMSPDNIAYIDPDLCINCGICASACPTSTIELIDPDNYALYGIDSEGNATLLQETLAE